MPKPDNLRERSRVKPQGEDAAFLVEEFDMQEQEAADLVARDGVDADAVAEEARKLERRHDPLRGEPVPKAPTEDVTADADEEQLKPVIRDSNKRQGAG